MGPPDQVLSLPEEGSRAALRSVMLH